MAEYINKESAISIFNAKAEMAVCTPAQPYFANAAKMIEILPAADVAPVVHGMWIHTAIEDDDWGGTFHSWTCSNCDFSACRNQNGTNYCPNCGAKMDLEG